MKNKSRMLAAFAAVAAATIVPDAGAHGQTYGTAYVQPAPIYPYVVQQSNTYVVPQQGGYVVQQQPKHAYPYMHCVNCGYRPHRVRKSVNAYPESAPDTERRRTRNDPALIAELRKRGRGKIEGKIIHTKKIVREKPIVIVTKRYVDDPPRVIERHHVVEDEPRQSNRKHDTKGNEVRVIHAEAEVTIIGPDRMSIRLFRKRGGNANAKAD
ncbi:MAG: hypothetical protein WBD48_09190 [Pseudolabrys sp.]